MDDVDALADEIGRLYPAVYERLHASWQPDERRPSPEASAVLQHLHGTGPLTVSEAAQHFGRALSAVSELFDRIEANGWIARTPDARDRRRTLVWLTDAGIAMLDRQRQVLSPAALARALAAMTPEQRDRLRDGLKALVAAADAQSMNVHKARSEP